MLSMVLLTAKYDSYELIHIHFNTLVFKKYLLRTYMRTVRMRVFQNIGVSSVSVFCAMLHFHAFIPSSFGCVCFDN